MINTSSIGRWARRLFRLLPGPASAFALLCLWLAAMHAGRGTFAQAPPQARPPGYLPVILSESSPAGSYDCLEYEFGLIWTSEVITLNANGSSVYDYDPPYSGVITGAWTYTPSIREVGFTGSRWPTATYILPDRLWARKYLEHAGFEIALSCSRR